MGPYHEHRRIEPVRRLSAVSKNEAMEMTDVERERRLEKAWDAEAAELRKAGRSSPRKFSELVPKR
jgi:hypothetical protein